MTTHSLLRVTATVLFFTAACKSDFQAGINGNGGPPDGSAQEGGTDQQFAPAGLDVAADGLVDRPGADREVPDLRQVPETTPSAPDVAADANVDRPTTEVSPPSDLPPDSDSCIGAWVAPTDEQSCVNATCVLQCDWFGPGMYVSSAPGGPLLTEVKVASGLCLGGPCSPSGPPSCSQIAVSTPSYGMVVIGATCDLVAIAADGRSQSFRITVVQSGPVYSMCCGYLHSPYPGLWATNTPLGFDPSQVVVDFNRDGGVGDGGVNDGAADRVVAVEASVLDADGGDANAQHCSTPLAGSQPFGAHLAGSGTLYGTRYSTSPNAPHQVSLGLDVYFPGGRVAGAPVLLAMPVDYADPALQVGGQSLLATDLSATGLTVQGGLGVSVTGTLLPPDDGLSATVGEDLAMGTDIADQVSGALKLCPTGSPPTPGLAVASRNDFAVLRGTGTPVSTSLVAPTSHVLLKTATPIDAAALAKIRLFAGDVEVPVTVAAHSEFGSSPILLGANAAFPPLQPLRLDTTTVTDILGRPVPPSGSLQPLAPTGAVSDLTFATAPTGALATTGTSQVTNGMLVLGHVGYGGGFDALLALGSVAPATQARLRIGVDCQAAGGSRPSELVARANLVGVAGDAVTVPLACGAPQDVIVPLPPSAGNIWLSVVSEPTPQHPQFSPYSPYNEVQIDEIAFE